MRGLTIALVLVATCVGAQDFPVGTRLRLTAIPDTGWTFVGWTGAATGLTNPLEITLGADTSITATFDGGPPDPPLDATLTINVVGGGSVAVTEIIDPPPPPDGDQFASVSCPTGLGGAYVATTTIPNDPLGDGCVATPMDVSAFFTDVPYSCATLKPGLFYTGSQTYATGERLCQDVTTAAEFKLTQNFNATQQMVAIVHNDITITAGAEIPWLASKGEMLIIGIVDALGKPPEFTHDSAGTIVNWQITSGNLAILNVMGIGELQFGSAQNTQLSTLTLMGVTHETLKNQGTSVGGRLILTRFEGGNDPTLPIDDEIYFKNVLVRGGPNSHNVYLDRNGLQYVEGLVSYGNRSDGAHALKLDGRLAFLYGSWLSSAGVHDNLIDDNSGQAPLSSVACQQGVYRDNHFLDAIDQFGGIAAAQAQIRVAIAACDYPQGWLSNTYPTTPYTGPLTYRGTDYSSSPYWNESWWTQVAAAGTEPPELYVNPDMLKVYWTGNRFEVKNNGSTNTLSYYGIHSDPTFPTTYPGPGQFASPRFTNEAPPARWFERVRHVMANNCFVSGSPDKMLNHWPGRMHCADSDVPAWLATYGGCATGATHPDETDKFVRLGANECGVTDAVAPEMQAAIDALEAIPNPPWRTWIQ